MRKKLLLLSILAALCLLAGCKVSGNPLPEGMEEETLLEQGREIVTLLNEGGYQDKAQAYVRETEAIATGQKIKDTGEQYGTAVFYCKHEKKSVMYRIAYSTDLELMGIQVSVR